MALPSILIVAVTILFLVLERLFPGRALPQSQGWYWRVLFINFVQLAITLSTMRLWIELFGSMSVFRFSAWNLPVAEGLAGWVVGTFVFYWWHRVRHRDGFWLVFHQLHHSPSRIEALTSFYKHPVEILADSVLSALVLYPLLGCSLMGAFWYNFFAACGEYFYHANIRTPKWIRFLIQTPELHSVHHQFDVHRYNFSDIPIWDRIFGTYRDTTDFVDRCGFPAGAETRIGAMLFFKDVYHEEAD
ncbi:sterol desaturase family protein [Nocardioides sp.]|uniref:sterol desaturase family protein n=1 Tax=Nocardioides sp. TaxID=35761 RepID=UPI0031FF34DC|nr:putative sterol desaturase [Nocardioides sp.]